MNLFAWCRDTWELMIYTVPGSRHRVRTEVLCVYTMLNVTASVTAFSMDLKLLSFLTALECGFCGLCFVLLHCGNSASEEAEMWSELAIQVLLILPFVVAMLSEAGALPWSQEGATLIIPMDVLISMMLTFTLECYCFPPVWIVLETVVWLVSMAIRVHACDCMQDLFNVKELAIEFGRALPTATFVWWRFYQLRATSRVVPFTQISAWQPVLPSPPPIIAGITGGLLPSGPSARTIKASTTSVPLPAAIVAARLADAHHLGLLLHLGRVGSQRWAQLSHAQRSRIAAFLGVSSDLKNVLPDVVD